MCHSPAHNSNERQITIDSPSLNSNKSLRNIRSRHPHLHNPPNALFRSEYSPPSIRPSGSSFPYFWPAEVHQYGNPAPMPVRACSPPVRERERERKRERERERE